MEAASIVCVAPRYRLAHKEFAIARGPRTLTSRRPGQWPWLCPTTQAEPEKPSSEAGRSLMAPGSERATAAPVRQWPAADTDTTIATDATVATVATNVVKLVLLRTERALHALRPVILVQRPQRTLLRPLAATGL